MIMTPGCLATQGSSLARQLAALASAIPGVSARWWVEPDPLRPGHDRIWLLRLDAHPPGRGAGSRLLEQACALADRLGVAIELTACPNQSGRLLDLVHWYAAHGFVLQAANDHEVALRRPPLI